MTEALVIAMLALPVATALACSAARSARVADAVNVGGALLTSAAALALAVRALAGTDPALGSWYVVDGATGVFAAVIAVVGLIAALASPAYLAAPGAGFFGAHRARTWYYAGLHVFWAALLALAVVDNLGIAWLLAEATTGASAMLVAFSGRGAALEAGWKYLVLTTFGLTIALVGIVVLYVGLAPAGGSLATLDWRAIGAGAGALPAEQALLAFVLILAGLAAKIGWAPVHNWLPDAHSEGPPPVSALLSAALLPTIMLVAWRVERTLGPALGDGVASGTFLAFGLVSMAIAVPFLWRPLPWKRLLAYSSLEHMGVIALGIGFATPLATAGVVIHVAGHALAKALGFCAALPLLHHAPDAATGPARGLAAASPGTATAAGVSLATLGGLPPSPLFASELLILLGGIAAGELVVTAIAAALLALGFLGLAHALTEGLLGEPEHQVEGEVAPRWRRERRVRLVERLTLAVVLGLLALTACAVALADSGLVRRLMEGVA